MGSAFAVHQAWMVAALMFASSGHFGHVALVNGVPIAEGEFRRQLQDNVSGIHAYFHAKHRAEDSKDFWSKDHNGENPLRMIREKTLRDCVRIKVQQILAQRNGILEDPDYQAFLGKLEAENRRRRDALAKNIPVYGPLQFDERTFFEHGFNSMRIRLTEKLATRELKVPEAAARQYYRRHIQDYKRRDSVKVKFLSAPFDSANEAMVGKKMAMVMGKIEKGESFEDAMRSQPALLSSGTMTLDESSYRFKVRKQPKLLEAASRLDSGQVRGVIRERSAFYILVGLEKKDTGFQSFEKVKAAIELRLVDRKYQDLVDHLALSAKVVPNQSVLDKIHVRN